MIVIGIDPHKDTHSAAAVDSVTGQLLDELTVRARQNGFKKLLTWARNLGDQRQWALEDGRHVSGGLERFLLAAGEHVVRVPPKLMARERKTTRSFGKSDPIHAISTARAALREPDPPVARPAGPEHEIALLCDHRECPASRNPRHRQRDPRSRHPGHLAASGKAPWRRLRPPGRLPSSRPPPPPSRCPYFWPDDAALDLAVDVVEAEHGQFALVI